MCLAIPGRILQIKGNLAVIDYGDEQRQADCSLIKCRPGDYVIVSNRIVIDRLDKAEAKESLRLYREAVKQ